MSDTALLANVKRWALARATRLRVQRVRSQFVCDYYERGDPECGGDDGVPVCYRGAADSNDWCEPCRQRDTLYAAFMSLRLIEKRSFRSLCALVDRERQRASVSARATNAVDPNEGIVADGPRACECVPTDSARAHSERSDETARESRPPHPPAPREFAARRCEDVAPDFDALPTPEPVTTAEIDALFPSDIRD